MNRQSARKLLATVGPIAGMTALLLGQVVPGVPIDADHDGIPDDWEQNGVTLESPDHSTHFLDLKAAKASPGHKDVIVWVDWMGSETITENGQQHTHNHNPRQSSIGIVQAAFANAKQFTDNPDGTAGVNLIVLVSPTPVPHQDLLGSGNLDDGSVWTALGKIRDSRLPAKLKGVAHYCLFAHDISPAGTSGISFDIGATDFIVSLGQWQDHAGNEAEQAGTFMHELGHNLGLRHGGMDDLNYKPNYLSVMNYFFQTDGLSAPSDGDSINYSTFAFPDLNEADLDETKPLTMDPKWANWGSAYFCPSDKTHSRAIPTIFGVPVDWNCDGQITTGVTADPNGDNSASVLRSQTDWDKLRFTYSATLDGKTPATHQPAELTLSGANQIPLPPVRRLTALAQAANVRLSWMPVSSSRVRGYEVVRNTPNQPALIFTTTDATFVDQLPKPEPSVRYEVRTLFVPHGASPLVTILKKKEDGLDLLSIGTKKETVKAMLADSRAVAQLQQTYQKDLGAIETFITSASGGRGQASVKTLTEDILGLGALLASQAASVEVKLQ